VRIAIVMQGARMHYAVPRLLAKSGLLGVLYTDVYLGNSSTMRTLLSLLPRKVKPAALRRLEGRCAEDLPDQSVVSFNVSGAVDWMLLRLRSCFRPMGEVYAIGDAAFGRRVAKVGFGNADTVYGTNGASLEVFSKAKKAGLICILEQTIAPRRIEVELEKEEQARWLGWPRQLWSERANVDTLRIREEAEWALADKIICASPFVANSLRASGISGSILRIVPYGVDVNQFVPSPNSKHDRELRILFVGQIGLRKGVPYLLEAVRSLNRENIRVRLVGHNDIQAAVLEPFRKWLDWVGPVPRSEILGMYHWANLFVLPTLCEGSATAIYEAMACGLPVITTPNAGSVLTTGEEGYLVPIRDSLAIAGKLEIFLREPSRVTAMGEAARKTAQKYSLEDYGLRLLEVLRVERRD